MKIGIIGTGMVGSATAFAAVIRGVGREIVLVDADAKRSEAEAEDILHAVPFATPMRVRAGGYSDLAGCRAVVVAAGVGQRPGESRIDLLARNAEVFRDVIPAVLRYAPGAVLVVATNPVDVMTHLAARYASGLGLPSAKVLGSGTTLDTARFRALLSEALEIDARHVHAYVIGEHGDSEVLTWSLVTAAGMPLDAFSKLRGIRLGKGELEQIDREVRGAAYRIIEGKRASYYGIAAALVSILDAILNDRRAVLTVCRPMEEVAGIRDVTLSLPSLVGGEGLMDLFPLPLAPAERESLGRSAGLVRNALDSLETTAG